MLSVITTCKGRWHHLAQTILCMARMANEFDGEVIVVDYDDPDSCSDKLRKEYMADLPIRVVKLLDKTNDFNPSHARNLGGVRAKYDVLAFVDADVFLKPAFSEQAVRDVMGGATLAHQRDDNSETMGTCVVKASAYREARGYNEAMVGWGFQDCDFYRRVRGLGPVILFDPSILYAIHNDDEERTKFYADKRKERTNARNHRIATQNNAINPHGYGEGNVEVIE